MSIFHLPDLGEGLPEAEVREWYVAVGDEVKADQPMVSMETAKAVVDVPAPQSGVIAELHGGPGDIVITGAPLVTFVSDKTKAEAETTHAATVAGKIEEGNTVLQEAATGIQQQSGERRTQILPALRMLAESFDLNIDTLPGTGANGSVCIEDLKQAIISQVGGKVAPSLPQSDLVADAKQFATKHEAVKLRGVRRAMVSVMADAHARIVPVTLVDDADIDAWPKGTDISLRVLRALKVACQQQPELNAWFDQQNDQRLVHQNIHVGLAMDSAEGLFVPVLRNINSRSDQELRADIERFKIEVGDRSIAPEELRGATIMLSNFGVFAGRYANPVLAPPCVAIIGTGKIRELPVVDNGQIAAHRILPISVTIDHRVITGGELARFLRVMLDDLALAD